MFVLPFSDSGEWLKGNLHTHSNRSDGALSPEEVVQAYRDRGYDFLSLTDHFLPNSHFRKGEPGFIDITDTRPFDDDALFTVLGAELHGPAMENGETWHLVANGLPLDFPILGDGETGLEVARRAVEAGAHVSLAHPYWNGVSEIDALQAAEFVHGVEIYNHASQVGVRRGYGDHMAELMLAKGHRLSLNAADDAHFKHPQGTFKDAFGGWVMVQAASRTQEAVIEALKAGAFYASTGPDFHSIEIDGDRLRVVCSPVDSIIVSSIGAKFRRTSGANTVELEAELPPVEKAPYVRVTIADAWDRVAWSNPIWR